MFAAHFLLGCSYHTLSSEREARNRDKTDLILLLAALIALMYDTFGTFSCISLQVIMRDAEDVKSELSSSKYLVNVCGVVKKI